jgi:predicted membrane-bound spermidine synthase
MSDPPDRPRWQVLLSVFLVSFAVLAFEVSLTRVFSVLFTYHFVFLAVSGAICGLGLGGFGWHLLSRTRREPLDAGWPALAFALLMPGSIVALFGAANLLAANPWACLVILIPFSCAGAFLAEVFRQQASDSGRLYQADLAGAAIAAVTIVPLISIAGALYLVFCLGGLAALAAALWGATNRRRFLLTISVACGIALFASWPLSQGSGALQLRPLTAPARDIEKDMVRDLSDPKRAVLIDTEWTAYARTDFIRYELPDEGAYDLQLFTDGGTPSTMIPFKGDLDQVKYLRADLPFLAFDLSPRDTMLSIGPGGGMDLLWGKLAGFERIDGVEINESVARLMDRYRKVNGDLYHEPGIHITAEDGRSFVRRSTRKYDLISSSLTQTATTSTVGLSLVESYIHTVQAFDDYYQHLTPEGRYALVTQRQPLLMRAALTAIEVMEKRGVAPAEACRHLLAVGVPNAEELPSPYRYLLVWNKSPFKPQDLTPIRRAIESGAAEAIFLPGSQGQSLLHQIANGETTPARVLQTPFTEGDTTVNIRPATDDRPFFLDLTPGVPSVLVWFLIISLMGSLLYSGALLARSGERRRDTQGWLLYFSALGVGFMLVEIPLIQKLILLLGRPTLSLTATLFYLLIGASIGSRISQAWPLERMASRVAAASAAICALILIHTMALGWALRVLLPLSLSFRLLALGILIFPVGLVLGIPFPSGLRLMSVRRQVEVPWMWGVNGMMSVTGSVLAVIIAKLVGFNGCLLAAAALYAGIGLFARSACALPEPAPVEPRGARRARPRKRTRK